LSALVDWSFFQIGAEDIFADVFNDRLIFISLANASVSREYYNMRKVKSKHVRIFSAQQPPLAEEVAGVLRDIDPPSAAAAIASSPAPLPLSMLLGGLSGSGGSGSVQPLALGGTYLSEQRGPWGSAAPLQGGQAVSAGGSGMSTLTVKQFKAQLGTDTMIGNLQRSLNNLSYIAAELSQNGVDVDSLRKLLSAQMQLARATRLMLK
jgi:hypothetical protein